MRLFSIILWHHFAYMIISLALLGYGASGTLLPWCTPGIACCRVRRELCCACRSVRGQRDRQLSCWRSVCRSIRWRFSGIRRQPLYLLAVYLLLALPFLCAGACVCMAFSSWRGIVSRIYSFDLLGAGAGALRSWYWPCSCCRRRTPGLISAFGFAAAAVAWPMAAAALAGSVGADGRWRLPVALRGRRSWLEPVISPYKGLSPDPADSRQPRRGRALQPARPAQRGREPQVPIALCAGVEPQHDGRAAAAVRRLHRRRGHDRA